MLSKENYTWKPRFSDVIGSIKHFNDMNGPWIAQTMVRN
jgi:hypothetical protein